MDKLDSLTMLVHQIPTKSPSQDHEDVPLFSALPVDADDFIDLENLISVNPSSRLRLVRKLIFLSNCLK